MESEVSHTDKINVVSPHEAYQLPNDRKISGGCLIWIRADTFDRAQRGFECLPYLQVGTRATVYVNYVDIQPLFLYSFHDFISRLPIIMLVFLIPERTLLLWSLAVASPGLIYYWHRVFSVWREYRVLSSMRP